jgi:hypothetical protein
MAMTGAGGKGMTPAERDAFLRDGAMFLKIATTDEHGWPMISPVWYDWDGETFLVVGKERTSYIHNLRRDQRCGILVENPSLPYKRVAAQAVAEFLPDTFDWKPPTREMIIRYIGVEGLAYGEATFEFPRVPIRIRPVRMTTWDGGGFDRTFHRETVWHDLPVPGAEGR